MRALPLLVLIPVLALPAPALLAGEPESPTADLVDGNTRFACDLYAKLRGEAGNLFLSPYSISTCLAMTREGAAENTADQMDAVFHFPSGRLGHRVRILAEALEAPLVKDGWGRNAKEIPAYEISIVNRLFGQTGYRFRAPFLTQLEKDYGAGLEQLDIEADPGAARSRINGWVEEKTREKIKDLLPEGSPAPDTRLVLVNAIYFKSSWKDAFRENATIDAPFHRADGSQGKARLMRRSASYGYGEAEGVQVLEMPYRSRAMSMIVVLPRAADGLVAVEASLTPERLQGWVSSLKSRLVSVSFPKFEFSSGFDLTKTLQALGMTDAFSATKADFSEMTAEEPLYIGLVVHKGFVAVDEAGTEAAAATAVGMRAGSAMPEAPVEFRADRPFLFAIVHRETGTLLFLGRVQDPE